MGYYSNNTRHLIGSRTRDLFKYWHKQKLPRKLYACDLDLVLIEKYPPGIAAVLDYKTRHDGVSFTECILYNAFAEMGIPVFIVVGTVLLDDNQNIDFEGILNIYAYHSGYCRPDPPEIETTLVASCITLDDFEAWETTVRQTYRKKMSNT